MANLTITKWDRLRTKVWAQACLEELQVVDAKGIAPFLPAVSKRQVIEQWNAYLQGLRRPFNTNAEPLPAMEKNNSMKEICPSSWQWYATPFWFLIDSEGGGQKGQGLNAGQLLECALMLPEDSQKLLLHAHELQVHLERTPQEAHALEMLTARPWTYTEIVSDTEIFPLLLECERKQELQEKIKRPPFMCFQSLDECWLYAYAPSLGPYSLGVLAWVMKRTEYTGQYELMRWAAVGLCWQLGKIAQSKAGSPISMHLLAARDIVLSEFDSLIYFDSNLAPIRPLDEACFGELWKQYVQIEQDLVDDEGNFRWPPKDYPALKLEAFKTLRSCTDGATSPRFQ